MRGADWARAATLTAMALGQRNCDFAERHVLLQIATPGAQVQLGLFAAGEDRVPLSAMHPDLAADASVCPGIVQPQTHRLKRLSA